jgi:hypothetical protein
MLGIMTKRVQAGYAVIFLSRKGSMQPLINHLPPVNEGADIAAYVASKDANSSSNAKSSIECFLPPDIERLAEMAIESDPPRLLTVHFTTVFEYICYLEAIAKCCKVRSKGPNIITVTP